MRDQPARISVVVPLYQEEDGIERFINELTDVLSRLKIPYEILAVDDGSRDRTLLKLRETAAKDPKVRIVSLSRNYGHQIALLAGLDHADGQVVITMDGDLQHPPSYIPGMIGKWREGFDIVNMHRELPGDRQWFKRACAELFYWVFNRLSPISLDSAGSDFRLIDRRVRDAICEFRQRQFFLRGIVSELGFRSTFVKYICPRREFGRPVYSFSKQVDLALRGLFSYSTLGLELPFYLGILFLIGLFGNIFYQGRLSSFSMAAVAYAALLLMIGMQGFYIARIYAEVRRQPLYCVKELSDAKP